MRKFLILLVFLCSFAQAQQPPFAFHKNPNIALGTPSLANTIKPVDLQLYARDSDDSATVTISGDLSPTGYDSIFVRMYKNGSSVLRTIVKLNYSGTFAPFTITHRIHAELSEYKFTCYVKAPLGDTTLLFSVDSVVCGDAYIIAGQSNGQNPDLNVTTNDQYCRTFGKQADSMNLSTYLPADTVWHRSSATYLDFSQAGSTTQNAPYNVSSLGMTLQKTIRDSCSIPTCFINGTRWGTSIISHQRNNSNPQELTRNTLYGRTLYRVTKAGLTSKIKAIIWYQGEIDVNAASGDINGQNPKGISGYTTYANKFDSLYNSWKADYTGLQKIYVMQVRPLNCAGSSTNAQELRETQRQLQNTYSDVEIVSTMGIGSYLGCHYAYQGYQQLAGQLFKRLDNTFYRPTNGDSVNTRPPTVRKVFFVGTGKDTIAITFNNSYPASIPADSLGNSFKSYFYLNKARTSGTTISSIRMSNDTMFLKLSSATSATRLSWCPNMSDSAGNVYNAPFARNSKGLAMLTFDNVHIFEVESNRLFTRMTLPTLFGSTLIARQNLVDSVVKFCKTNGVWTGDAMYVFANADTGSANVNWLSGTTDSFRVVRKGNILPTFTTDKGYTQTLSGAVASDSSYLNTQFRPSVSGVNFTLNSGSVAVYIHDNVTYSAGDFNHNPFGCNSATDNFISLLPVVNNVMYGNVNDGSGFATPFISNTDSRGLIILSRTSSSSLSFYRNGTLLGTHASQNVTTRSSQPMYILGRNDRGLATTFFPARITAFRIGGSWNSTQATAFSNIMEYYMLQVGASYTQ